MRLDLQPLRTALRRSFAGFLDRVEPGLREEHRLGPAAFLDDSALADWPAADRRRLGLIADLSALGVCPVCPGGPAGARGVTVLVQIEPRVRHVYALERRLLRYYLWLLASRRRPVRLIVVDLQGGPPGVQPCAILETWRGRERLHLPYKVLRLAGRRLADWLV